MAVIKVTIVNFLMEQCVGAVQAAAGRDRFRDEDPERDRGD